jgi:hypothetical protein
MKDKTSPGEISNLVFNGLAALINHAVNQLLELPAMLKFQFALSAI